MKPDTTAFTAKDRAKLVEINDQPQFAYTSWLLETDPEPIDVNQIAEGKSVEDVVIEDRLTHVRMPMSTLKE